ncbi:aspartic peptidase, partial [Tanacetum coccineum]
IGDDRAPALDGFSSAFFKKGWNNIGVDVCHAIRDFFVNGRLLKEINHTFIVLIPKVSTPFKVNDYRPTSCCNVIYKCISKILTNRIINGIKEVVSDNQFAFVLGRRILDNILITQELMHNYHRNRGPHRCAFKIDIQKAYDTVDWRFLGCVLKCFDFHPIMIKWIMAYVTSTSFSLSLNGDIHGFFKGKRGLRQGDPLSPCLFTLVMDVLTLMLNRRINLSGLFQYHKHSEELRIINVCFTDDLFIFACGDLDSAHVIMEALKEFKTTSGKSTTLIRGFLWCNDEYKRGRAKVAWEDICLPKREGGLGSGLESYSPPNLDVNSLDILRWRDLNGVMSNFSVSLGRLLDLAEIKFIGFELCGFPIPFLITRFILAVTLENLYQMDDEPMWAADHVVALTPGSAITIPETANEFAIKGNHLTLVKGN